MAEAEPAGFVAVTVPVPGTIVGAAAAHDDGAGLALAPEEDPDAEAGAVSRSDRVELHKRDALLAGTIRDLTRQLKLALSDQQNGLLEAARGKGNLTTKAATTPAAPLVPDVAELAAPFRAIAVRELEAASQLGWRAVAPDEGSPGVTDIYEPADALATAIAADLHSRLERQDGTADDDAHLADRVRSAYRELRSQRLGDLAAHYALAAFGRGQLAAAPQGSLARWVYDACGPDCLDNALAGPQAFGETFPTGHTHPPVFEGCRCLLVASAPSEEGDVGDVGDEPERSGQP